MLYNFADGETIQIFHPVVIKFLRYDLVMLTTIFSIPKGNASKYFGQCFEFLRTESWIQLP